MRTHFLVKPTLQLRHLAWTLFVVTLCIAGCWLLVEGVLSASIFELKISEPAGVIMRGDIRLGFVVIYIMALALAGIENYFFFHRVAGPLFVLERAIRLMAAGNFDAPVRIREGDQLADLIKAFEEMRSVLKHQIDLQKKDAA